jgi:hypothetical protein
MTATVVLKKGVTLFVKNVALNGRTNVEFSPTAPPECWDAELGFKF